MNRAAPIKQIRDCARVRFFNLTGARGERRRFWRTHILDCGARVADGREWRQFRASVSGNLTFSSSWRPLTFAGSYSVATWVVANGTARIAVKSQPRLTHQSSDCSRLIITNPT